LDGKLSRKQVTLMIVAIWAWATPFSVMPFFGIWGRFVPGQLELNQRMYGICF
jgi:r-opsin